MAIKTVTLTCALHLRFLSIPDDTITVKGLKNGDTVCLCGDLMFGDGSYLELTPDQLITLASKKITKGAVDDEKEGDDSQNG